MNIKTYSLDVPRLNPNDDELLLTEYFVEIGDTVKKGQIVASLESSKAIVDLEVSYSGVIKTLYGKVGEMIQVGIPLLDIEINAEELNEEELAELFNKESKEETLIIHNESCQYKRRGLRKRFDAKHIKHEGHPNTNKPYLNNYIDDFPELIHGENCYIGWGTTLTNVILSDQVWINRDATIFSNNPSRPVTIGSGSYIGPYVWIEGHGGIEIGSCVHIVGPGTCLYSHSGMKISLQGEWAQNPDFKERYSNHYFEQPIKIGNNVWIGPNCTVFPGTVISDNVVVLPNTLVKTGRIDTFSLVHPNGKIEKNSSFVKNLSKK